MVGLVMNAFSLVHVTICFIHEMILLKYPSHIFIRDQFWFD